MKHLLVIQITLAIMNTCLETAANWWLICSPLLAYTVWCIVTYIRSEIAAARILKRTKRRQKKVSEFINFNQNLN